MCKDSLLSYNFVFGNRKEEGGGVRTTDINKTVSLLLIEESVYVLYMYIYNE